MKPASEVRWLFYDYGSYLSVAKKLAEGSAIVYYFTPKIINGYPDHRPIDIGRNVDGIVRVKEYESVLSEIDAVYFADVHEPEKQNDFTKRGIPVFGCMYGSKLELDRIYMKAKMLEVGLPVNEWEEAYGIEELDRILKSAEDVYVKSGLRGDMETWKSIDYELSQEDLDDMKHHMDAYKNEETYIVEKKIPSIAEIGLDTFVVDGKFPEMVLTGIELKDTGYAGSVCAYKSLPRQLKAVTDKLADTLAELRHRGPVSNEVIIAENKKGYLLDWTARHPQPPTDLYIEMIEDYADVAWKIAQGIVPDVVYKHKYGVQLIIKSDMAQKRTVRMRVPEEYEANVKLKNMIVDENGLWCYTPSGIEMKEIGSVIGYGPTLRQAANMAKKVAEAVKGNNIKINSDCLSAAYEQLDALKNAGINYMQ